MSIFISKLIQIIFIFLYFIFYFVRKFTKNFFKTTSNDQKESDHKYSNQQKDIVDVDYEEVE